MSCKLNKSFIDNLPFTSKTGEQAFYYDTELKGFGLRVGNRTKAYFVESKVSRKTVRVTIGKHGIFAPEQARKVAKEQLATMAQNINPNAVEKEARLKAISLLEVYNDYMAARKSLKPITKHDYQRCINGYFKDWQAKPMLEITRDMVEQRHKLLSERSEARANLAMRFLRALFNFASEYRDSKGQVIIADNPVRRLSTKKIWNRIERRSNYIQPHQLKKWWDAVWTLKSKTEQPTYSSSDAETKKQFARSKSPETIRDYLLVTLFTGLRREEALSLAWSNIDLEAKTLTVKDTKNRTDHTLPLSDFLFDLFLRRKAQSLNEWVFEGDGKLGRIVEPRKQMQKVTQLCGIQFTSHDLRRTFASIVNMLGDSISYYTVKRLLNHKSADVTAGYVQHDIEKLRIAMQAVTDFILNSVDKINYEEAH